MSEEHADTFDLTEILERLEQGAGDRQSTIAPVEQAVYAEAIAAAEARMKGVESAHVPGIRCPRIDELFTDAELETAILDLDLFRAALNKTIAASTVYVASRLSLHAAAESAKRAENAAAFQRFIEKDPAYARIPQAIMEAMSLARITPGIQSGTPDEIMAFVEAEVAESLRYAKAAEKQRRYAPRPRGGNVPETAQQKFVEKRLCERAQRVTSAIANARKGAGVR